MDKETKSEQSDGAPDISTTLKKMETILDGGNPHTIKESNNSFVDSARQGPDFLAIKKEVNKRTLDQQKQQRGSLTAGMAASAPKSKLARTGQQFMKSGRF